MLTVACLNFATLIFTILSFVVVFVDAVKNNKTVNFGIPLIVISTLSGSQMCLMYTLAGVK